MPNMIGQSFFCLILINAIQIITKITMGVQCAYSQLFKKKIETKFTIEVHL